MQELRTLETPLLIDMLVAQMDIYTRLLNEGATEEEFARCSLLIRALQAEIESRKHDMQPSTAIKQHN